MRAMPIIIQDGKFLELRNSDDSALLPAMEIKSGEDMREAAKRAADAFFGLVVPDEAIKEGFQARVGSEVVALYPVDASKMDMTLLRPAEEAATWAWKNVPESMGHVVALGFPRNLGERRNGLVTRVEPYVSPAPGFPASQNPAQLPGGEAGAVFSALQASVAAKTASLRNVAPHERPAREAELEQEREDLRLMAEDLGIEVPSVRMNAEDSKTCPICAAPYDMPPLPGCVQHHNPDQRWKPRQNSNPVTARALIKQNDGTIIAARQKDGRSLLPGGHLDAGETPEAAVARELQEELGIDIRQALTGETYDFEGDGLHRVFVVDGSKLDLSKLQPGDDVEEAEIFNSPFTDSHGVQHPGGAKADAGQAAMLAEGVEHVAEDIQEGVEADPSRDAELMHDLAEGIEHESREIERENATDDPVITKIDEHLKSCPTCKGGKNVKPSCEAGQKLVKSWFNADDGGKEWWCKTCGKTVTPKDREPGGAHADHQTELVSKRDNDAGAHGHEYPGKMDGPFPVVRCNGSDTIATQETVTDWRCEGCGDVIAGPKKPAIILEP